MPSPVGADFRAAGFYHVRHLVCALFSRGHPALDLEAGAFLLPRQQR
jgi:hypothetical protein